MAAGVTTVWAPLAVVAAAVCGLRLSATAPPSTAFLGAPLWRWWRWWQCRRRRRGSGRIYWVVVVSVVFVIVVSSDFLDSRIAFLYSCNSFCLTSISGSKFAKKLMQYLGPTKTVLLYSMADMVRPAPTPTKLLNLVQRLSLFQVGEVGPSWGIIYLVF
jgi:hypothetical protein